MPVEVKPVERIHGIAKSPHPGENRRLCLLQLFGVPRHTGFAPEKLQGLFHIPDIAGVIIDDSNHRLVSLLFFTVT